MEEIFSHMDGRFEVTLTDSTMMRIVHCAMNKAQEKMKTKKGVIERLNEISKFYELAVMQLEGCLSFVRAETERSSILDSNHEEVLADLREIKDRLQGRLEESEMAISKKDRELTEKLENELKLRQALELKEGEIVSSGVNIQLEKKRRNDEDSDDDFSDMKTCVNQQMLNINERLESHGRILGEVPHSGIDNKVEEMGSDIDILKQTLDVTFGKIQNALFFGEMGLKEQQWKLTTEKEIMSILIKSYMREFQENIEAEVRMQGKQVLRRWWEYWSQLMNEVTSLRHELGPFISQNELLETYIEHSNNNTSPLFSQENIWHKISQEMVEKPASEESDDDRSKRSLDKMEKLPKEESTEDGSNFVAKLVKKHQSIIRRKSEELNISMYGALLKEKRASPTKKEKELHSIKERIQNITARLDNLINWNSKVSESLSDQRAACEEINEMIKGECTLESNWEKMKGIFKSTNEERNDKSALNKEKEEKITEGKFLGKGVIEEFHYESFNFDIEKQIEESVFKYYVKEAINEWNECVQRNNIESQIKEEVYFIVFSAAAKVITSFTQDLLAKYESNKVDEIENTLREDVGKLVFKEMVEEYSKTLEDYNTSMEYRVDNIQHYFLDHLQLVRTECLLKEDLCMVVLRRMFREWKVELDNYCVENLISEQLQQFIMVETLKDAVIFSTEVKSHVQDKTMEEDALSNIMLNQVHEIHSEERLIKILLESLLTCFEAEESLMLSARSEIKEHSRQLDLGSERGELHEHEIFEDLLIGEEQTFYSLTSKVENALQQLGISKALLIELGTTLGLRQCNSKKNHNETITEEGQLRPPHPDFSPLLNFLQTFTEFEGMVNQKLRILTVRLENLNYCLDPVVELYDFLRSKESTFRRAFNRRCQNLQKAELEVDLLGDQVDALLTLLEKIYVTLYHYAPVLQQYFEVSNMLELIKKQLIDGAV